MTANSIDRSKLILFDPKARTEHFKRSAHNDFATASELRDRKFSGWRENKILSVYELWLDGSIKRNVSFQQVASDPDALEKALVEYMGLI